MKDKEAKRLASEKAQIEALIEKHRPRTPKTPDEVNTLGTGKNANTDGQERGKPKQKPQEQRQNPPKAQEADETYTYDSPNNYYHSDDYTAPGQSRGHRPFNGQGGN